MTVRVTKPEFNLREKLGELDKPTGLKGNELMRSDTAQDARDLIGAGRRNKIINGDMRVAQRGTSESGVTSSGYKQAPDRFRVNVSGPTITVSQSTDSPDGFSNSYKIDITTADTSITGSDRLILQTRLEGQDLQDFAKGTNSAKDFIFSFYCKSTKMGTFTVELQDTDNTSNGGARSVSRHFTISSTGWNRYEINFGADTVGAFDNDNNKSIDIFFWLVAGPSYSGGSSLKEQWAAHIDNRRAYGTTNGADSTSNEFYFTGVQLEVGRNGGNATEFEHRSFAEELALCQRYFQSNFPVGVPPQNGYYTTTQNLAAGFNGVVSFSSNNARSPWVMFHPKMRTTPTVTLYSASSDDTDGKWAAYKGSWNSGSGMQIDYFGSNGFGVRYAAGGHSFVTGEAYLYRGMWSATAEL